MEDLWLDSYNSVLLIYLPARSSVALCRNPSCIPSIRSSSTIGSLICNAHISDKKSRQIGESHIISSTCLLLSARLRHSLNLCEISLKRGNARQKTGMCIFQPSALNIRNYFLKFASFLLYLSIDLLSVDAPSVLPTQ
jgi:hypothetical protein